MKRIACCILIAGCQGLAVSLFAAELIAHWPFDEGVGAMTRDAVGGRDGAVQNAVWATGKKGAALEFTGSNSYVRVPAAPVFNLTTGLTLSAWIHPKAYPDGKPDQNAGLVGKNYGSESAYGLRLGASRNLHFRVYGPFGKEGSIGWFDYGHANNTEIRLHEWQHAAVTYDGERVRFFINGRLDSVYPETRSPLVNDRDVFIGALSEHGRWFTGLIDEVKIYRGALDPDAVRAEYEADGGGSEGVSGPVPAAAVKRAGAPPSIDGVLDEAVWQAAAPLVLVRAADGKPADVATAARLTYDDDALYVAFRCEEPAMDRLQASETQRGGRVWEDDCVEIFVDSNFDRKSYSHYVVNANGVQAEGKYRASGDEGKGWETEWQAAVVKGKDFWTVEVAIPFATGLCLGGDIGPVWGVNLARQRRADGARELSAWSPTGGPFHRPERYGMATGLDVDVAFYQAGVAAPSLRYELDGGRLVLCAAQTILNPSGSPRELAVTVSNLTSRGAAAATVSLPPGGSSELVLPVALLDGVRQYRFLARLLDKGSGRCVHQSIAAASIPELVNLYFDRNYYTEEPSARLNGKIEIAVPGSLGLEVALTLRDAAGQVAASRRGPVGSNPFSLDLDIAGLPPGVYEGVASLRAGDTLIYSGRAGLVKRPPNRYEIKADCENLVVLENGRPFFPIGISGLPQSKIPEFADAGFNVCIGGDHADYLDTAYYHGMRTLNATYHGSAPREFFRTKPPDELEAIIRAGGLIPKARVLRTHPAFFGYFWDEPGEKESAGVAVEYRLTQEADPYHPVVPVFWQSHGPPIPPDRYDVLMHDPYWYPGRGDTVVKSGQMVANHWKAAQTIRKPLWIMPQSDGWCPGDCVITPAQQRAQTYLHLIENARGILYWTYRIISPPMKPVLFELAGELQRLSPILLTPSPAQRVLGAEETGIRLLAKTHGAKTYLLAVNTERTREQAVRIAVAGLAGERAAVWFENRSLDVEEGKFSDRFPPYATRVYELEGVPAGAPLDIRADLLDSKTVPPPDQPPPPGGIEAESGIEKNAYGVPCYWEPGGATWDETNFIAVVREGPAEGQDCILIRRYVPTRFSEEAGFGWVRYESMTGVDLYRADNPLLRDGASLSKGVFRSVIPNGRYRASAVMRAPGPMFEVEGGVRRALAPVIREIPEMAEAFPDFKARLREYVLEGEIGDGSVDWEIESGSVYALRIEPLDGGGPVRRFDFGTESSPVADGNLQVAAPRHRVQAWYVHPDLTAAGGKTYRVRMELQSEEPGRSIGIGIRPHAWSSPFSTKWQTLNLGEGWGTHAVLYTAPEGLSGRLRVIFNPDGSPGTVRLGKVDWEDARP